MSRARLLVAGTVASAIGFVLACQSATGPSDRPDPTPPPPPVTAPAPFVVSAPVARTIAVRTALRAAQLAPASVAYVSLPPGSMPLGVTARIAVVRTADSVITSVSDGGFDPVPIPAIGGDTIDIAVRNVAGVALTSVRFTVPNTRTPPIIVRTDPPPRKRDVPLNPRIVIVFSLPIDTETLSDTTISLSDGVTQIAGELDVADAARTTVSFVPKDSLAGETDYTLTITTGLRDVNGVPLASTVTVPFKTAFAPQRLLVTTQPASGMIGAPLPAVVVSIVNPSNQVVTAFGGPVTVLLGANPGNATLSGGTTTTAFNGVATFSTLTMSNPGTGYTFVVTAPGFTSVTTQPFDVVAGTGQQLVFGSYPSSAVAGAPLSPITVIAHDVGGNVATTFAGTVTVTLTQKPTGTSLGGTVSAPAVNGVATFSNLRLDAAGAYRLAATATGLAAADGATFTVGPAAASTLNVVEGGGQSAPVGAVLQPIILQVADAFGNAISEAGHVITFAVLTGGGVAPAAATTDAGGQAQVTWTLGPTAGAQSLSATSTGLGSIVLNAAASAASRLMLVSGGAQTGAAGTTLAPIVARVTDAAGVGVIGQTVTFVVTGGGGSVAPASVTSDALGIVTTAWTLGATPGSQTMEVRATFAQTPLVVTATAVPVTPLVLSTIDPRFGFGVFWWGSVGIGQYHAAFVCGEAVAAPFTVTLSHTGTAHTNTPSSVTMPAGASPCVQFSVAGASAGSDVLVASATGHTSATATTTVDKGVIGLDYDPPLILLPTDSIQVFLRSLGPEVNDDNVVAATSFTLGTTGGLQIVSGGSPSTPIGSITIPAGGHAVGFWLKAVAPGAAVLTAASANYQTSTRDFTVSAPAPLQLASGGDQTGSVYTTLNSIIVKLSDAAGHPVAGKTVMFAVASGGGSVNPATNVSDTSGFAYASWTLGPVLGAQSLTVTSSVTPNTLTVNATATTPVLHLNSDYYGTTYDYLDYWPSLGIGMYRMAFISIDFDAPAPITVSLTHSGIARLDVPVVITIPAGSRGSQGFPVIGTSEGSDAAIFSAPGFAPLSIGTDVGKGVLYLDNPASLKVLDSVQVTIDLSNPVGYLNGDVVAAATTFSLSSTANVQLVSGGTPSTPVGSVIVPANSLAAQFWVKGVTPGVATITLTNPNFQTYVATITILPP